MNKNSITKRILSAAMAVVMTVGAATLTVSAKDVGTVNTEVSTVLPLNGSGSTLTVNQTYDIPTYISGKTGNSYKITVSNNGVLKYKDGKITAVTEGKGTVNVVFNNGKKLSFTYDVKLPEKEISLDKTKLAIKIGQSSKLNAKLKNSTGKIIWKSSNSKVVSVDSNGKLKANNAGVAVITATSDKGITSTCQVTVGEPVEVTAVNINTHFIAIHTGESYQLHTSVSPSNASDQAVKCSSLDTSVATVSYAKVTAKAPGKTKIVVKSANGKYSECDVVVTDPKPVEVTKVNISKTAVTLKVGESIQLHTSVSPSNATDKSVKCTIGNPKVATVSYAKVTAKRAGKTKLTVTSTNGKTATCIVTVVD